MKQILIILSLWLSFTCYSQEEKSAKALLIIDVQEFYFPGGNWELSEPEEAAANSALLLHQFREDHELVIFVKHDAEPGGNIHPLVEPLKEEQVITKKDVNSFKDTALLELLRDNGITSLVLCGMQTHMCLEAATRAAADYGFQCTVISDACATRDLTYEGKVIPSEDVHSSTLVTLKSYAEVTDTKTYLGNQ